VFCTNKLSRTSRLNLSQTHTQVTWLSCRSLVHYSETHVLFDYFETRSQSKKGFVATKIWVQSIAVCSSMCCSVLPCALQYVAGCCSALQCVAVCVATRPFVTQPHISGLYLRKLRLLLEHSYLHVHSYNTVIWTQLYEHNLWTQLYELHENSYMNTVLWTSFMNTVIKMYAYIHNYIR